MWLDHCSETFHDATLAAESRDTPNNHRRFGHPVLRVATAIRRPKNGRPKPACPMAGADAAAVIELISTKLS